jgi:N-acetylglucosaminyl-diphospho-decaprenol L-rhamnosyltransferase
MKRTTIITVTYNSALVIRDMIASVPDGIHLIVVDNASTDDSAGIAENGGASVIRSQVNHGFGLACNMGAGLTDTEFLLFLNPDAVLEKGAIAELEKAADTYPGASAFNPRITDAKGGNYFKRSSRLLPRKEWMKRGWPNADCEVSVLSGAAFFCRREQFNAVGGFDPNIFLYHEDDDLALRLKESFGPLMFIRSALVTHQEGRSSPRSPEIAKIKSYNMARSRVYAMRKHNRPFAFWGSLWSGLRKIISPDTLFIARKRAQAFAFVKGVISTWA